MQFEEAISNQNMENFYDDDDSEAEDTLSLCDYSINTIAAEDQQDYSMRVLQSSTCPISSSSSSDQEHYFEFCSGEWSTTSTSYPPENIIFCGKIIPSGEPSSQIDLQNLKKPVQSFGWNGSHNISIASSKKEKKKLNNISTVDNGKISGLTSSIGKFRWSLFLFGGSRRFLPTEMVLRDIKSRQSRRRRSPSSSTLFGLKSNDHDNKEMSVNNNVGSRSSRSSSCQLLLGLLKAIGFGGQRRANNVVKVL
ncbi:hypothetical protein ACH5RR_018851 [Cinchona calisaya]|uniref:Uncharacterized protein n=1 Tax=Cinchona calisaya TaxID=153742 RepID=A0ABD2ZQF3_9GENT